MQLCCTTKTLGGRLRQALGADPSKQLPCPCEDRQHSAQSSTALSSYSSECQEFIWIKLKVSWIWLSSPQLSNLIHERDSHAPAEQDKQDASTRVTRMKEIVFLHSLNLPLLVLGSTALPSTLMDLGWTVREWVILQQHPEHRDTEAPDPKSMLSQQSSHGARALSLRRIIMMCLSACVTQRLPFADFFPPLFSLQKHDAFNGKLRNLLSSNCRTNYTAQKNQNTLKGDTVNMHGTWDQARGRTECIVLELAGQKRLGSF